MTVTYRTISRDETTITVMIAVDGKDISSVRFDKSPGMKVKSHFAKEIATVEGMKKVEKVALDLQAACEDFITNMPLPTKIDFDHW